MDAGGCGQPALSDIRHVPYNCLNRNGSEFQVFSAPPGFSLRRGETLSVNAINPQLLAMLVCPATRSPLELADDRLVQAANRRIARRELRNQAGEILETPLDGGLLRSDRLGLYPIVDGIPILLIDECIPLEQLPEVKDSSG